MPPPPAEDQAQNSQAQDNGSDIARQLAEHRPLGGVERLVPVGCRAKQQIMEQRRGRLIPERDPLALVVEQDEQDGNQPPAADQQADTQGGKRVDQRSAALRACACIRSDRNQIMAAKGSAYKVMYWMPFMTMKPIQKPIQSPSESFRPIR